MGRRPPSYLDPPTTIPDALFDEWLSILSGDELKVLLYVMRHNFGFNRTENRITLAAICAGWVTADGRRLDAGTGLPLDQARAAVDTLAERGMLVVAPDEIRVRMRDE